MPIYHYFTTSSAYPHAISRNNCGQFSHEKINIEELHACIREHGVKSAAEVDLAMLEADGNISILSHNFSKHSSKKHKHQKTLNQRL